MIELKDWKMHSRTKNKFFMSNDLINKMIECDYSDENPVYTVKNLEPIKDDERRKFITVDEKFERIKRQDRYELDLVEVILYCEGELNLCDTFSE